MSKNTFSFCVFAQVIRGTIMAARERWQSVGEKKWMDKLFLYKTFRNPPRYLERTLCYPVDPGLPREMSVGPISLGLILSNLSVCPCLMHS